MPSRKISIVISLYNEERRLPASCRELRAFFDNHGPDDFELICVNDGSTDRTVEVLETSGLPLVLVDNGVNRGKGAGLRSGVARASGDFVYLCDGDLSTPIEEIPAFLAFAERYDCVIGSRALAGAQVTTSWHKKALGRIGNGLINLILGLEIRDTQCGFKLLNRKAAAQYLATTIDRWGVDFEFLYLLKQQGLTVKEIPVSWVNNSDSRVTGMDYLKTFRELLYVWKTHKSRP